MNAARRSSRPTAQRGLTLIVVMLILVVVMILGVGGAQIALLGERSTRYDRDYLVASQAAEAALLDAEYEISSGTRQGNFTQSNGQGFVTDCGTGPPPTGNQGLCATVSGKPVWATVDFTSDHAVTFGAFTGRTYTSGATGIQPAHAPAYIVERISDMAPGGDASAGGQKWMYRVTAMGFGPRLDIQVVMQTAYRN